MFQTRAAHFCFGLDRTKNVVLICRSGIALRVATAPWPAALKWDTCFVKRGVYFARPRSLGWVSPLLCQRSLSYINMGVFQRPLTLILLQKYRDTNGTRIVIQIGGVYTTLCQEEGIVLQKYRARNGRCIAMLFRSIGVRGRFGPPEKALGH